MIDPTMLIFGLGLLVALAVVGAWLLSRRRARPGTHTMSREDSISYYRDLGAKGHAPGVQEEEPKRWGGGEG